MELKNKNKKKKALLFSLKGGCLLLQEILIDFRSCKEEMHFFKCYWTQYPTGIPNNLCVKSCEFWLPLKKYIMFI